MSAEQLDGFRWAEFAMHLHNCIYMYMYITCMCDSDFGASGEEVEIVEVVEYVGDPAYGTATTQLHKVSSA